MVPGNCPADQNAYLMDDARARQSGARERPVSLPVIGSAPVPVPSQRRAYEQMQRASVSPRSPARGRQSSSGKLNSLDRKSLGSGSPLDVGSFTPPNMTFAVGTPPSKSVTHAASW